VDIQVFALAQSVQLEIRGRVSPASRDSTAFQENSMNKKLIALSFALGAFATSGAALAQGSSVTIYGTFNVDFENVERDGATGVGQANSFTASGGGDLESRNRVSSNSSNIGFRGTEDLGNGLKAIFQCESGVAVDSGAASSSTGSFCTRNSNVGLNGPWGTVFYGNWDTPYKFVSLRQDPWYATGIGSHIGIIGTPGFGVATTTVASLPTFGTGPTASFDRRQGDSVQYWSPSWNGLSFRATYSANEAKSADDAVPEVNPYLWGGAVIYENGPLYVYGAYERHEDNFGLSALTAAADNPTATNDASEDQGIKVGVGYTFGNTTLNLLYENLDYESDQAGVGLVSDYDRDAFYVSLLHKIGAWTLRAGYGHADEGDCDANGISCNSDELGADEYTVGASYSFSKRTDVYALYVYIDNDDLASYNFGVNALAAPALGGTIGGTAGVGASVSGFGLGIRHTF
jgi:predicted porin